MSRVSIRVPAMRTLAVAIAAALLAGCGSDSDSGSGSNGSFTLSGNLQTYEGIRGTTVATTSSAPLTVNGANVSWQATTAAPWIRLQTTSGSSAGPVSFSVNPTGLTEGVTEGIIRVTNTNTNVTLDATVSLTVRPLGLNISPTTLTLSATPTSGFGQQTFTISDELNGQSGAAAYNWFVQNPSTFAVVTPASGTTATSTAVAVNMAGFLNAASGETTVPLTVSASGTGSAQTVLRSVTVNAQVAMPRLHTVYPNIVEPGPVQVTLVGKNIQPDDVARLRVNGAAPVGATRVSDREVVLDLGVLAAGRYKFTYDNSAGVSRSSAELLVTPRGSYGPGEIAAATPRQRLLFDSHRGVLYASNVEEGAIQRYTWDGASWNALPAITAFRVRDIDFGSDARHMYATSRFNIVIIDLSAATPTAASVPLPQLTCYGENAQISAPGTGTVHSAMPGCRSGSRPVSAITYDTLLGAAILPPQDALLNSDVAWLGGEAGSVSADRRYVTSGTRLWDSQTNEFLFTTLQHGRQPIGVGQKTSMDLHATKVLFGGAFVLDRSGTTLCTAPSANVSVLSSDGTRLYSYNHVNGGGGEIKVLSTAASGPPTAADVCATLLPAIPVPQNIGNDFDRPDPLTYGQSPVFAMTASDDGGLLFLSGPTRILAIQTPP